MLQHIVTMFKPLENDQFSRSARVNRKYTLNLCVCCALDRFCFTIPELYIILSSIEIYLCYIKTIFSQFCALFCSIFSHLAVKEREGERDGGG